MVMAYSRKKETIDSLCVSGNKIKILGHDAVNGYERTLDTDPFRLEEIKYKICFSKNRDNINECLKNARRFIPASPLFISFAVLSRIRDCALQRNAKRHFERAEELEKQYLALLSERYENELKQIEAEVKTIDSL